MSSSRNSPKELDAGLHICNPSVPVASKTEAGESLKTHHQLPLAHVAAKTGRKDPVSNKVEGGDPHQGCQNLHIYTMAHVHTHNF